MRFKKMQFVAILRLSFLLAIAGTARISAQHSHDHDSQSWKKGMVRLTKTAWAGNFVLQSGMYHVQHVIEGDKHWLVFKEVLLRAGYQEGTMWEGKEVARLECRAERAEKSVLNTKVVLVKTSGGVRSIQEIQIAGEEVKHIL